MAAILGQQLMDAHPLVLQTYAVNQFGLTQQLTLLSFFLRHPESTPTQGLLIHPLAVNLLIGLSSLRHQLFPHVS